MKLKTIIILIWTFLVWSEILHLWSCLKPFIFHCLNYLFISCDFIGVHSHVLITYMTVYLLNILSFYLYCAVQSVFLPFNLSFDFVFFLTCRILLKIQIDKISIVFHFYHFERTFHVKIIKNSYYLKYFMILLFTFKYLFQLIINFSVKIYFVNVHSVSQHHLFNKVSLSN